MPKRYNEYESWNVVDAKKRTTKEKLLDESNPFRNDPPMAPDPKGPGGPRKKYDDGGDVKKDSKITFSPETKKNEKFGYRGLDYYLEQRKEAERKKKAEKYKRKTLRDIKKPKKKRKTLKDIKQGK